MIVDRENLTHPLATIDGFQDIDVFVGLARQEINLKDTVIEAKTTGRFVWVNGERCDEPVVLNQRILHYSKQSRSVGADCKALHSAIGLAARRVVPQLGSRVAAGVAD